MASDLFSTLLLYTMADQKNRERTGNRPGRIPENPDQIGSWSAPRIHYKNNRSNRYDISGLLR
jgi:hypothetical protein